MIRDLHSTALTDREIKALVIVFSGAFESADPHNHVMHYLESIDRVLLYYQNGRACAFLFYQIRRVDGVNVLHLSLSGKVGHAQGLQKKLGSYLYFSYVFSLKTLFRTSAFVTVSNNPRSYFNMYAIGPTIYPDVLNPNKPFSFSRLYQRLPKFLSIEGVQPSGLIPGRCSQLGFRIRSEEVDERQLSGRGQRFMAFLDRDADNGALVMVCVRPVVDVPRYFLRRLVRAVSSLFKRPAYGTHGKKGAKLIS